MSEPSVFGEIPGVPKGTWFPSREAVRLAGLHRHDMAGISGRYSEGADAIVVSGGYKDDRDEGNWILYTGQGGNEGRKQVRDQKFERGNFALAVSEEMGLPVRVIRRATNDAGVSGYSYDGLFSVKRHWSEPSSDGPLIYRFELVKEDEADGWEMTPPPVGAGVPKKLPSVVQRLVRNSAITQWVKELYDFTCQFCSVRLEVDAGAYAEGAHVRPLGGVHAGRDDVSNVLCLCPNDHVLFDKGALHVDAELQVIRTVTGDVIATLELDHYVNPGNFAYQRQRIAGQDT
jgi:putative restriction endonuclease